MPQVLVTETHLGNIADAIREKGYTSNIYTPAQMAPAILGLITFRLADNCAWGIVENNSDYEILDDSTEFGGT